jgi:hypothetical protein
MPAYAYYKRTLSTQLSKKNACLLMHTINGRCSCNDPAIKRPIDQKVNRHGNNWRLETVIVIEQTVKMQTTMRIN